MKLSTTYIILSIILLLCPYSYGQSRMQSPSPEVISNYNCIDTTKITIRYNFKYKLHHTDKSYFEDIRVLQIGTRVIKEFSEIAFRGDSLATIYAKKGMNIQSNPNGIFPYELFYNIGEKRLDVKCRLSGQSGVLLYQPRHRDIEWEYSQEDCEPIHGYTCNKATAVYAGRHYTAWYTIDVPTQYGPYRFMGLPGMVVKLEESTKMYEWQLISVNAKSRQPVFNYTYDEEIETDEETANKTISRMLKNPLAFEQSTSDYQVYIMKNGKLTKAPKEGIEYPYEPIEL